MNKYTLTFSAISILGLSSLLPAQTVFGPPLTFSIPDGVLSSEVGDADGDGDPDIFVGTSGSQNVRLFRNEDSVLTLQESIVDAVSSYPTSDMIANDYDQDGDADIFVVQGAGTRFEFMENTGQGSLEGFGGAVFDAFQSGPAIELGDLDGNGFDDVIISTASGAFSSTGFIRWYRNTDGVLGNFIQISSENGTQRVLAGDIDGDNDVDILDFKSSSFRTLRNNGNASFSVFSSNPATSRNSVHLIDLDGDNDVDIVGNTFGNSIFWNENLDGNGTFSELKELVVAEQESREIALVDIDNDGDLDIFSSSSSAVSRPESIEKLTWFENTGGTEYKPEKNILLVPTSEIEFLDYDMDQDQDILLSNDNEIIILENRLGEDFQSDLWLITGN